MKRQSAQLLQIGCDQGQVGWHSSWQRRYCNSRRAHGPLRPTWKRRFRWWNWTWQQCPLIQQKRTMRNAEDSDLKMFDATSLSQEMSTPDSTNLTGGVQNYTFGPADTENSLATAPLVAASDDSNANRSHLGCGSYTCCSTGFPVATLHCKTSNHVATNRNISPVRLFWVVCSWYRLICRCM